MTAMLEEDLDAVESTVVHWSTGTILTIFFASSLVAALFFGLGFTFGPAQTAKFAASTPSSAGVTLTPPSDGLARTATQNSSAIRNTAPHLSKSSPERVKLQPVSAPADGRGFAPGTRTSEPREALPVNAANKAANAPVSGNRYVVQVGAIGNRRDAQKLVSRLRRQGFHAGIYPGKRDRFLHVQLGPFASTQQAQAVRRRVMAHGYYALLKPAN